MNPIERHYQRLLREPSDIRDHLPYLRSLSSPGVRIVEFGFRTGLSATAFLAGGGSLHTYDVTACEPHATLFRGMSRNFHFHRLSSLDAKIGQCDILFIDSKHTYAQLAAELERHHDAVVSRIVLHDTETFKTKDKGEPGPGLQKAIDEFLSNHPQWRVERHVEACNGLTTLQRL